MALLVFTNRDLEQFFQTGLISNKYGWFPYRKLVLRKLDMIHYAETIQDLRIPPGNRLEMLKGDLFGFYSIRVNKQWRIIFRWVNGVADSIDVQDYH